MVLMIRNTRRGLRMRTLEVVSSAQGILESQASMGVRIGGRFEPIKVGIGVKV